MYAEDVILLRKYLRHFEVAAEIGKWGECAYAIRNMQEHLDGLELHTWKKIREGANNADTPQA